MLGIGSPYSSYPPEWWMMGHRFVLVSISLLPGCLAGRIIGQRGLIWGLIVGVVGGFFSWEITLKSLYDVLPQAVFNAAGGAVGELHYRNAHK